MYIDSRLTENLLEERWYHFDFRLVNGWHKYTIGTELDITCERKI